MNDTFMKEKPILPLILSMSLPMVLSMLVNSLYNIVDSFFVAQISEEAMTALSLVYPVQNFINAAGIGFGVGINAVIAFYLGAGNHEKADQAATQGLVLAVIHGVVMTVCCIAIMPVFLRMFTASEAVIELGVRYSAVAHIINRTRRRDNGNFTLRKPETLKVSFAPEQQERFDRKDGDLYNELYFDNSPY